MIRSTAAVIVVALSGCATCGPSARLVYSAQLYGGPRPALPWGIRADGVVLEYVCDLPLRDRPLTTENAQE